MNFLIRKKKLSLGLFLFLVFTYPLAAQFQGYDETNGSATLGALFSKGSVVSDPSGALYGNLSFLNSTKSNHLDFGAAGSYANGSSSALLLFGAAYFKIGETWGVGIRGKPVYQRSFPTDERFNNYAVQGIVSKAITEHLSLGLGIGPGISGRPGGYGSYSWNLSGHMSYQFSDFKLGMILESPGSYRYDKYLGSEILREKLPERAIIGISFQISNSLALYAEGIRTFWEKANFILNKSNELPSYPVDTMYTGNFGISVGDPKVLQYLGGFGTEGKPLAVGGIKQLYGGSLGLRGGLFPSLLGEGYSYTVYIQRIGFGVKETEGAETRWGFQFHSQFGSMPNP